MGPGLGLQERSMMTQQPQTPALEVIQKWLLLYRYIRRYTRKMQCEGLRGRELSLLRYLTDAGPLTIGQIRDYLFLSASSTSELVSRMEEAGYVARRRSTEDTRVVFVELTPAGNQLSEETPLGGIPLLRERVKGLPLEKLDRVNEALTDLLEVMEIETYAAQ
jgi:DNA-binding MarR family transcriptional regulator